MEFLNNKEHFVTHTEKLINELKDAGAAWNAKTVIDTLTGAKTTPDYQEVYLWLKEALCSKHTEQTDLVDKLTTEQCRYANYLVQAVHDSVTISI